MISGDIEGGGVGAASPTLSGDIDISECLKGIMGSMPPPFLIKIYSIVNDPETNSIISWSSSGTSFIIWDHLRFSAEILPMYFKHNILSSFVSQLNNYGFRKVGVEHQWEYENPYFQAGNEYMLSNIRRRLSNKIQIQNRKKKGSCIVSIANDMETKLQSLRDEIKISKLGIQMLEKQQEDMESVISTLEADMNHTRNESYTLLRILCEKGEEIIARKMSEEAHSTDGFGEKRKYDHTHENSSTDKKQKTVAN
ncbi:heat stress transcription factor A-2-like [Dorcoceras hygrometricum]|uniref:Heat stress transcription factor A-2-like n=1 Tax=Dorcoceras hygrometricum TaxID=472368 RepID=A0A2Z7CUT1_9LAMI|nr:heat stress transcription factor A-2-like [Dorcoceras hygrometricum]